LLLFLDGPRGTSATPCFVRLLGNLVGGGPCESVPDRMALFGYPALRIRRSGSSGHMIIRRDGVLFSLILSSVSFCDIPKGALAPFPHLFRHLYIILRCCPRGLHPITAGLPPLPSFATEFPKFRSELLPFGPAPHQALNADNFNLYGRSPSVLLL